MPHTRAAPPLWLSAVQYVAVRAATALLTALPFRLALRVAAALALLFEAVDAKHRRVAMRNIAAAYPGTSPAACRRMARGVYRHLATMLVEILFAPRLLRPERVRREIVHFEGLEHFDRLVRERRGAIVVIAHLGNWEVGGCAFTLIGYPIHAIARPLDNPLLDRYLNRFRTGTGQGVTGKYGVLRQVDELLQAGKFVVFLADQDARQHGLFVPFFGRPASTVKGPAVMALRCGVPIILVNTYRRDGPMRFTVEIHPPLAAPPGVEGAAAVRYLVEAYTRQLESFIRRHPDQYLWLHRRWKTRPPEEKAASG